MYRLELALSPDYSLLHINPLRLGYIECDKGGLVDGECSWKYGGSAYAYVYLHPSFDFDDDGSEYAFDG
jgi:hypothetical protein